MKGVIGLAVFVILASFTINLTLQKKIWSDPGRLLAVAFADTMGDTMQFQIGVGPATMVADPPEIQDGKTQSLSDWSKDHYQLYDAKGQPVELRRMGTSALMLNKAAAGAPEFVLWADLQKGESYHCDFVPVVSEGTKYRYTFEVPQEQKEVGRKTFVLIEEDEG